MMPSPRPGSKPGESELDRFSTWPRLRYLDLTLPGLAENLALDEALLVEAEENDGPGVLRTWELDHFAVVLGASCRIAENVRGRDVPLGRRSSGGGTVVIGPGAINFTVVLPVNASPEFASVDTAQKSVLERVARSIREEGLAVLMQGSGDLTLDGRKFSGSAQRRLRRYLMIHASLLYDFPLDRIDQYTRPPPRQPGYRQGRPHLDFVTNLPISRDHLLGAILRAWSIPGVVLETSQPMLERARRLAEEKFSKIEWIERL